MRNYSQAKAFAAHQHASPSHSWYNLCQKFARQCVGAPPFGVSARKAFNGVPEAHRHTGPPPPGSIAYYGHADRGAGHAVFAVEGGYVWSNDIVRHGKIDRVKWDVFVDRWHLPYRGWIEMCASGRLPVQLPGVAATAAVSGYRRDKKVYRSKMRYRQSDSDSVWNLQVALAAHGHPVPGGPSGHYGSDTRKACAAFQHQQGWTRVGADGIAGPHTIERLGLVWVER